MAALRLCLDRIVRLAGIVMLFLSFPPWLARLTL